MTLRMRASAIAGTALLAVASALAQVPTEPAPLARLRIEPADGEYLAFRFGDASRIGFAPECGGPGNDNIIFHWTGSIRMTEVEGTGETIRRVHNLLHTRRPPL